MHAKKRQARAKELEAQIAALEAEIAGDEESLANFVSAEETMRVASQLDKRRAVLNTLLEEWEQASQEV
jgi:small-conductance mechanosensitive channel